MRLVSDGILLDMMMLVVKRVGRSYGGLYDSEFSHDKVFRVRISASLYYNNHIDACLELIPPTMQPDIHSTGNSRLCRFKRQRVWRNLFKPTQLERVAINIFCACFIRIYFHHTYFCNAFLSHTFHSPPGLRIIKKPPPGSILANFIFSTGGSSPDSDAYLNLLG